MDGEAVGLRLVAIVTVAEAAVDQGGFADAALANEEEFGFVEGADGAAFELLEVVEDVFDGAGVFVQVGGAEDFRRNWEGVLAEIEGFEVGELGDRLGNLGDFIGS